MSSACGAPAPAPFEEARAALDRHLATVLGGLSLVSVGWERPEPLTLYIPLRGYVGPTDATAYGFDPIEPVTEGQRVFTDAPAGDDYLLRLYFSHYPTWPPSARFVNPVTRQFDVGDGRWLPMINGATEVYVHPSFGTTGIQLICCSATLEFYLVDHDVQEFHRWRPGNSFAITLNTLSRHLRPPTYFGRQAP